MIAKASTGKARARRGWVRGLTARWRSHTDRAAGTSASMYGNDVLEGLVREFCLVLVAVDLAAGQRAVVSERQLVEAWCRNACLEREVREYERVVLGDELGQL